MHLTLLARESLPKKKKVFDRLLRGKFNFIIF